MGPGGGIALGNWQTKRSAFADSRCIDDCWLQALGSLGSHSRGIGHRSTIRKLGASASRSETYVACPYAAVGDPLVEEAVRQLQAGLSKSALVPCHGIDALTPLPGSGWDIRVSQENESSVQVQCDSIISLPQPVRDLTWMRGLEQTQRIDWQAEACCDNVDWPGWKNATKEPHYYLLGSKLHAERTSRTTETIQGMQREFAMSLPCLEAGRISTFTATSRTVKVVLSQAGQGRGQDVRLRAKNQMPRWALVLGLALPTAITLVYFSWLRAAPSWIQQVAFSTCKVLQFSFPVIAWFVWRPARTTRWSGLRVGQSRRIRVYSQGAQAVC